jgi:sulfatase maturation enzyme AslB (radical SAM superfamily)
MLVGKIINNEVILWVKECLRTHLFNIPTRTLEAHTTYIFWHKALGHSSHHLIKYVNAFSDGDLILSKPKNFDCDYCLQSKSTHTVPKTLQDHVKSKFEIIHSDVHGPLAIQLLGGKRYFVMFIKEFS